MFGDKDVPAEWTAEITAYIKALAPTKLTIDGTYGINESHLNLSSVDIYSDHFYPLDISKLSEGVAAVEKAEKVYFAAEYGWTPESQTVSKIGEFFEWIESRNQPNSTKPVVVGGKCSAVGAKKLIVPRHSDSEDSELWREDRSLLTRDRPFLVPVRTQFP